MSEPAKRCGTRIPKFAFKRRQLYVVVVSGVVLGSSRFSCCSSIRWQSCYILCPDDHMCCDLGGAGDGRAEALEEEGAGDGDRPSAKLHFTVR